MNQQSGDVIIHPGSPLQEGVRALLAASDRYHQSLYPAESYHLVDVSALLAPNVHFLVAQRDNALLGCGAVRIADDGGEPYGELKRMWVDPAARGTGLGGRILAALEDVLRDSGITLARLETGIHQPQALGLYRARGYRERPPFGDYIEDPLSVFMEKSL